MDLRRSRWILGVVLASFALVGTPAGADEPNFTEEQKIDFMQHAKVVASKPEKKGKSNAVHLTLSDGKVSHDASFQPIDERKVHGPAPGPGGGIELNFRDYWGYDIAGYRIAKLLGVDDMIPVYTERKWNGTRGSISWRVPDVQFDEADRHKQNVQPPDLDAWAEQMYKVRVLTQLFYDMDPNLTNVLITKDWKIWRIDFSRAFRLQHDLKDPKDLVQCDRQVLTKLRQLSYDQVFDATKPYLTKDEVKALIARRDKMAAYFELIAQKGESQVLLLIRAATRLALARGVLQPLWRNPFRSNPFHFGSAFRFQNNFRFPLDFGVPWAENSPEIAFPKSSSQPFGSAAPPEAKR